MGVLMDKGVQPVRGAATTNGDTQHAVLSSGVPRLQEIALTAFTPTIYFMTR
jgi:hypothetical protein